MARLAIILMITLVVVLVTGVNATARTWYILQDGSGDAPTIQAGIDLAAVGDTVLVACGTYTWSNQGTGNANGLIRMKSGIYLSSETGLAGCVTIDAEQQGGVLYCDHVDNSGTIRGFTVTGGSATWGGGMCCFYSSPSIINCTFLSNSAVQDGGGICCRGNSSPALDHVTFSSNTAGGVGGGMDCITSSPTLSSCSFSGNSAVYGGGLYSSQSPVTLASCVFSSNTAVYSGGGMCSSGSPSAVLSNCTFLENSAPQGRGGGLSLTKCSPTLANCIFSGNSAENGGGISCFDQCLPRLNDCGFYGNSATTHGGAVYLDYSSNAMLVNCILSENSANGSGGGMFLIESISTLANCTFSENRANVHGGGICCFSSSAILENTIVAFSTQGEAVYCWGSGTVALTCCDVYGNAGGDWVGCIAGQAGINGNFSADPLFCAPENGDFRLSCTSPCVNRYGCGQIGAFGVGCGPTSVEYTTWGRIKAMFK